MIKIHRRYSPLFNKNYLIIKVCGRRVIDTEFTPNIFVAPFDSNYRK